MTRYKFPLDNTLADGSVDASIDRRFRVHSYATIIVYVCVYGSVYPNRRVCQHDGLHLFRWTGEHDDITVSRRHRKTDPHIIETTGY